jgi:hypothetical protein
VLRLTCAETKVKPCAVYCTANALSLLESCSSPVKFCYERLFPHSRCFAPVLHILLCYNTKYTTLELRHGTGTQITVRIRHGKEIFK